MTTIGVIIGIAAIVSLLSLGQGLQNSVDAQFAMMGVDMIIIMPGTSMAAAVTAEGLTDDDVETLEKMSDFKYVAGMTYKIGRVKYKSEEKYLLVSAIQGDAFETVFSGMDFDVEKGRFFGDRENDVLVIGMLIEHGSIFKDDALLHSKIYINDVPMEVVGVLEEIGNPADDSSIMMPLDTFREIYPDEEGKLATIMMVGKDGTDLASLVPKVERKLERARGDENFQVITATQYIEQVNSVLDALNLFVAAIAAISLIVGAIGIMNTMYTSILERTHEIGVMKAVGARNNDILIMFMIEAGTMGLGGGIIGSLIGGGIAWAIGMAAEAGGIQMLKVSIEPGLILGASFFAFLVGAVSGYLPAKQAAKMNPSEAMRY